MKIIEFEYVDKNKIITIDREIQSEIITNDLYELYVDEMKRVKRNDIELIPSNYYEQMKYQDPIPSIQFDDELWKTSIEPKLPTLIQNTLLPFQKQAIFRMYHKKRLMNACDMGLGKSIQAISIIHAFSNEEKGDLIVCPGSLRSNWKNEFKKWAPEKKIIVIDSIDKKKEKEIVHEFLYSKSTVMITSYELASKLIGLLKPAARKRNYFNSIIVDESHYLKEPTSKRYCLLRNIMEHSNQLFLLSGTPSPNRPAELQGQLALIDPNTFSNRRVFCDRYCNGYIDQYGRYNDRGCSKRRELGFLLSYYMIRLRKDDCLSDLPDVSRNKMILPCHVEKDKYSDKLNRVKDIIESKRSGLLEVQQLVSKLFLETSYAKIESVLEYIRNNIENDDMEKTIIFCTHRCMYEAIENLLENKCNYISICGNTPKESRQKLIDRFLKGDAKIALLTLGTCSTGLTLTPVRNMIFTELHWCPSIIQQAECRINRIGGAKGLEYTYLLGENTLDEYIFSKLSKKTDIVNSIIDQNELDNMFLTF